MFIFHDIFDFMRIDLQWFFGYTVLIEEYLCQLNSVHKQYFLPAEKVLKNSA